LWKVENDPVIPTGVRVVEETAYLVLTPQPPLPTERGWLAHRHNSHFAAPVIPTGAREERARGVEETAPKRRQFGLDSGIPQQISRLRSE
jgi:hypothetical protein